MQNLWLTFINPHFLIVMLASFLVYSLIIRISRFWSFGSRSNRDVSAKQSAHFLPTPRIGGLGIIVAVALSIPLSPDIFEHNYLLFCLSLLPVFVAGLAEDFGYGMSPFLRLLAVTVSSLIAITLLNVWLSRADVPGFDILLSWAPLGIMFTLFATAGISNAFNLIDGVNGLAGVTALSVLVGLALIAQKIGFDSIVHLSVLLSGGIVGFLLVNYPRGKIFLGDAGAYSIGYILSWFSIWILYYAEEVTTWAMILVFFWPIADTFLAIYRRVRKGGRADQPDRLHYHQLVMRTLEIRVLGRGKRHIANPLTTLIILPFIIMPCVAGVIFWDQPFSAFLAVLLFGLVFVGSYLTGIKYAVKNRVSRKNSQHIYAVSRN